MGRPLCERWYNLSSADALSSPCSLVLKLDVGVAFPASNCIG